MVDRIKILIQKRTSLKAQITGLSNILDQGRVDAVSLKLRFKRLTDLYHKFEDYNDELTVLDSDDTHNAEFMNVQDRYYSLASRIENFLPVSNISEASTNRLDETRIDNLGQAALSKKRRIKLPEASLLSFDGNYESWLSFKNAFNCMIGSQSDLSDVDKLQYLKSALIGEAANKIRILKIDGVNYTKAWDLLEKSYEVKRILISRHLASILNLPMLEKESTSGLSKLADDVQQHVASLNTLNVHVSSEMIVHILENKLPKSALERWETTLERDEFPTPDRMYEFLYRSAVCASKREKRKGSEIEKNRCETQTKRKRSAVSSQAFIMNTSRVCVMCKTSRHPLYLCDKFKQLSVQKRIDIIKNAKLCYNCLRSHRGNPCKFSNCAICQKRHNTLLHVDNFAKANKENASKTTPDSTK